MNPRKTKAKSPLSGTRFGLLTAANHKTKLQYEMKTKIPLLLASLVLSASATFAQSLVSWTTGNYDDNTILDVLAGSPSSVQYSINLGGGELTTENGYLFLDTTSTNITYLGFNVASPFLNGGTGLSVDSAFNSILGDASFFSQPGTNNLYTINNLVIGNSYSVAFLMADTRNEGDIPGRSFSIISGETSSPSQVYAYPNAVPFLGSYALGEFVATATTQQFVKQGDGQLNAIMVIPEPSVYALLALGIGAVSAFRFRKLVAPRA